MGLFGLVLFGGAAYYAGKKMSEHHNPDNIRGNINGWGCGGGWKRHHEEWKQFKQFQEQQRQQRDQQPVNEKPAMTREMPNQPTSNVDGYGYPYGYPPDKVQSQPFDSQYVYHAQTQGYWHPDLASVVQQPHSPTAKAKPTVTVRLLDDAPANQSEPVKNEYNHPSMTRSMSVPPAYAGVNENGTRNGGRVSPQMSVLPGQHQYPQMQTEPEKESGKGGYFWK